MKINSIILVVMLVLTSAIFIPGAQAQTGEKEYKELNPALVHTGTMVGKIACWGDNLAWASGSGNITTCRATGQGLATFQGDYWSAYGDLALSDQAMAWSGSKDYEQSNIYHSSPTGSGVLLNPANTDKSDSELRLDGGNMIYSGGTDVGSELRCAAVGSGSYVTIPSGEFNNYDISGSNVAAIDGLSSMQIFSTSGTLVKDCGSGYHATNGLRISGDYLSYYDLTDFGNGAHLYVKNWKTGDTERFIYSMAGIPGGMDIDGNFVIFSASKNPEVGTGDSCVFIYDIQAKKVFRVSQEYSAIHDVAIGGGRIAWMGTEAGTRNLYTAQLPAPGAPPADDSPINDDWHIIGRSGGILTGDGFKLDVPADSLDGDVSFAVNEMTSTSDSILSAFEILPAGTTFNPAAELTLDIPGTRAAGNELMRLENGQWVAVDSTPSATGNSLIAQITRTGTYAVSKIRDAAEQVIGTAGGTLSLPDVSLNIPANALASTASVTLNEVFMEGANIAQAVAVNLGGSVLSIPAQLSFDIPSTMDGAAVQVGQLVGNSLIEVESTLNGAGQLVADITEGGIYALLSVTGGSGGGIIDIPFPSGIAVLAVLLTTGMAMAVVNRRRRK